ncbi:MAG: GAF domain-containing protein [Tildeniella nuda ZEHNDER 1965/U140]|jgi:light-regulated signal transduction histidine kinase (bacteriophytochrome)/CheY-like chemotaxis protein|nr:GAF domain-containing protein [Tildeniella nuda ZEHNDER 1965/U140]
MNSIEFVTSQPIDLTNCDREPIHIPGQIQPHGVLLALQVPQLTILQVSQNTGFWLGLAPDALLGQPLSTLFSDAQVEQISTYLDHDNLSVFNPFELTLQLHGIDPDCPHPSPLPQAREQRSIHSPRPRGEGLGVRASTFKGILHRAQGIVVLELEPCHLTENHSLLGFYPLLQQAIANLRDTTDLTALGAIIVQEVQRMTGCDRVMVYRFEADNSGVVVAEAKQDALESFLGLHYPASDIPVQARKLYHEKWLRLIPDVHYQPAPLVPTLNPLTHQPLDLSAAVLRSVSPLHVEYLRNMGVAASMSISLITEKRLWGLIACHHYTPLYMAYETRQACEFLGQIASVELVHQQDRAASRYREQVKSIQDQFHQAFTEEPGFIEQVLRRNQSALLNLVEAQGAAMILNNQLTLVGQTPSETDTHNLMLWLLSQHQQDVFHTDSLAQLYADAKQFKDCASGILAISIFLNQTSYHILWFRPEQTQTVHWAGNPNKPVLVTTDGERRLSPRQSFDLWQETVQEKSFPWQLLELEAAQEMRNTLMLAALEFSQVALEQAAERAAIASRAKSQFLAKMSHELRTPLNAILGFTQIMSRDRTLPLEYLEHLGIISRSGEHLLTLINDVLEMSKIEAGQLTHNQTCFDLHRLIYAIKELFWLKAADKGLALTVEQTPDVPQYVCGDEGKLRQILINLVANAIKFTEGGTVTLRVRKPAGEAEGAEGRGQKAEGRRQGDRGQGNTEHSIQNSSSPLPTPHTLHPTPHTLLSTPHTPHPTPHTLLFEVEDTGSGIAPEEFQSIFEAFMQAEQGRHLQGTGLGLAISRQFAQLMGGDISVQSTVGKGSLFTCCVQLTAATAIDVLPTTMARRVIGLAPKQPVYRLLIVEDILENRQLLLELLGLVGFDVRAVENGLEATALWAQWHPHLILMDIQMPVMNGHEATRRIRSLERARAEERNMAMENEDAQGVSKQTSIQNLANTPHPTPHTPTLTPHTPHPNPHTPHPTPHTPHPTPHHHHCPHCQCL